MTLRLRLEKEGENKLVIEVSDSGIGILRINKELSSIAFIRWLPRIREIPW